MAKLDARVLHRLDRHGPEFVLHLASALRVADPAGYAELLEHYRTKPSTWRPQPPAGAPIAPDPAPDSGGAAFGPLATGGLAAALSGWQPAPTEGGPLFAPRRGRRKHGGA